MDGKLRKFRQVSHMTGYDDNGDDDDAEVDNTYIRESFNCQDESWVINGYLSDPEFRQGCVMYTCLSLIIKE